MSCIRFNTPAQLAQMRSMAPAMLTAEQAAVLHPAPELTATKIQRLRLLATEDPGERGQQLPRARGGLRGAGRRPG